MSEGGKDRYTNTDTSAQTFYLQICALRKAIKEERERRKRRRKASKEKEEKETKQGEKDLERWEVVSAKKIVRGRDSFHMPFGSFAGANSSSPANPVCASA